MADTVQMSEIVRDNIALIEAQDPKMLEKPIGSDPVKGPEEVASLLTYLPEDKRNGALVGFVMAMLCD